MSLEDQKMLQDERS